VAGRREEVRVAPRLETLTTGSDPDALITVRSVFAAEVARGRSDCEETLRPTQRRGKENLMRRFVCANVFVSCVSFAFVGSIAIGCGSPPSEDAFSTPDDGGGGIDSTAGGDTLGGGTDVGGGHDTHGGGPDSIVDDHAPPPPPPGATCESAIDLTPTATPQTATGDSSGAKGTDSAYTCASAPGPEIHFKIVHPGGDLWFDTRGTSYATLLALRSECSNPTSERACSDKTSGTPDSSRIVYRNLEAGTYFVILDATSGSGGAYALNYVAPGYPAQSTCTTPTMLVSDLTSGPLGADIWDDADSASMTSNVELRPGTTGTDTCSSATGRAVFGQGPDQIYRLTLTDGRKLKVTPSPIDPSAFKTDPPGTFDVLSYLRAASGPPDSDPTLNCQDSSSSDPDTCVTFGTEQAVTAGDYFLVFDSVGGSVGRYHMHVDIR
jgi:hypothetical protein